MRQHAQFEADKAESIVADRDTAASDVNNIRDFYLSLAQSAVDNAHAQQQPANIGPKLMKAVPALRAGNADESTDSDSDYRLTSFDVTSVPGDDDTYTVTIKGKLNKPVAPETFEDDYLGQGVQYYSGDIVAVTVYNPTLQKPMVGYVQLKQSEDSFTLTIPGVKPEDQLDVFVEYSSATGIVSFERNDLYQRLVTVEQGDNERYRDHVVIGGLPTQKQWVNEEDQSHNPVTIELLNNGEPTGTELKLNEDNGWSDVFPFPAYVSPVSRSKAVFTEEYNEQYDDYAVYYEYEYSETYTPHGFTFQEKNAPEGYTSEIVPMGVEKLTSLPDEPGWYFLYAVNGYFEGCVIMPPSAPVPYSAEELTQMPPIGLSQYLPEQTLESIGQGIKMEEDGTAYMVLGNGYARFRFSENGGIQPETVPSKEMATAFNVYRITPMAVKNTPSTSASVTKVWDDDNDKAGARPDSIAVTLSDGTEVTLSAKNQWTATVDGLPKYDEDGEEIEYTWAEGDMPEGYSLESSSTEGTVTTITNRYTPPEEPDEPGKPGTPDEPSKPSPSQPAPRRTVRRSAMPTTGDTATGLPAMLLGAGLTCLAAAGAAKRRKSL